MTRKKVWTGVLVAVLLAIALWLVGYYFGLTAAGFR